MRALLLTLLVLFVAGDASALIKHRVLGRTACNDGMDNDLDGETDFPTDGRPETGNGDDGCWDPIDDVEDAGYNATKHGALVTTGNCSSTTLSITNGVYTNCDWSSSSITVTATGVEVHRSKIGGVFGSSSKAVANSLAFYDTTFDALASPQSNVSAQDRGGWKMERVRCLHYGGCIYGKGYVADGDTGQEVYDSTFYYTCGKEVVGPVHGDVPARFVGNWFSSRTSTSGCSRSEGLTAVVAFFGGDGGFWSPGSTDNKEFIHNRVHMPPSGEGGDPRSYRNLEAGCGPSDNADNNLWYGNVIVGDGVDSDPSEPVVWGYPLSGGNVWKDNRRGSASTTKYSSATTFGPGDSNFSTCGP